MTDNQPSPDPFYFAGYDVTLELVERQATPTPIPVPAGARPRPWRAYRWVLHGPAAERERLYQDYPDLTKEGSMLYLLLLTVALEWVPSPAYLAHLRRAFRLASDYLYDVTDGRMAFEEVEFVGYEERHRAHVVVLASNRIHPRCHMEGLHRAAYPAITLGRGLWLPRYEMPLPWDEPEGYRTIIHEIAHAALGLPDAYLTDIAVDAQSGRQLPRATPNVPRLWIPAYTPDSYSMMGWPLIGSELHLAEEQIRKLFPLEPDPTEDREQSDSTVMTTGERTSVKQGPLALPLPLPRVRSVFAEGERGEAPGGEATLTLRNAHRIRHYDEAWLYLWRPDERRLLPQGTCLISPRPGEPGYGEDQENLDTTTLTAPMPPTTQQKKRPTFPTRFEPGRFLWNPPPDQEPRSEPIYRCEVVGARTGDVLLMVVEEGNKATRVYRGEVGQVPGEVWLEEVTPAALPTLCVVPTEQEPEVQVGMDGPRPDALWLFPLGAPEGVELKEPTEAGTSYRYAMPACHLDGHLLACWGSGSQARYLVTMFSQGGTGPGHDQVTSPPSAGALDGGVMVFFGEPPAGKDSDPTGERPTPLSLLTTQGHRVEDVSELGSGPVALASNQSLAVGHEPTLVFFYQGSALSLGEYFDYRPTIQRWGAAGWEGVSPVYVTTRRLIAALPLTEETAPNLFAKAGGIERYQLIWIDPNRSEDEASS